MLFIDHVVCYFAILSLSLKAHPVSFVREKLSQLRILSTADLKNAKNGAHVKVAGLVLVRQRPGTAGGICFMTIEDETGYANLVIFESLFEEYRKPILQSKLIMVEGKIQVQGEVIHVLVRKCYDISSMLRVLMASGKEVNEVLTLSRADERSLPPGVNKRAQVRITAGENAIPGARNFR
jgi:error-prone DNA polymerase